MVSDGTIAGGIRPHSRRAYLTLAAWLKLTLVIGGNKDSDAPKDAPEATAPATTPPANETPQDDVLEPCK